MCELIAKRLWRVNGMATRVGDHVARLLLYESDWFRCWSVFVSVMRYLFGYVGFFFFFLIKFGFFSFRLID